MVDYKAVVIGAGFSGLYMLYRLKQLGISARLLEAGAEVGGTWYWNRYPGARTDTEFCSYCFFVDEMMAEWNWTERYPSQSEAQGYLKFFVDRFKLADDIQFNTRVRGLDYDAGAASWKIRSDDGTRITAQYVINGLGPLSAPYVPDFPGMATYEGEILLPQTWPRALLDFSGKRVGIVGTGATGVQLVPELARSVSQLVVFQRTPNYIVPAHNRPLTDEDRRLARQQVNECRATVLSHPFAFNFRRAGRMTFDLNEVDRNRIYEEGWSAGGFRFMFETFDDILIDMKANESAAEFIRTKIRQTVKDPKVAELLCPKDYPYGAKRPPAGHGYFETFNRDNVQLVDVSESPVSFYSKGIRVAGEDYPLDVVILATGFDSLTGSFDRIDVSGVGGVKLKERWKNGAKSFMGFMYHGFPNMFSIFGPHHPFSNIPPISQMNAEWIADLIKYMEDRRIRKVEVDSSIEANWARVIEEEGAKLIIVEAGKRIGAFHLGGNIPGKAVALQHYFGGAHVFLKLTDEVARAGYKELSFEPTAKVANKASLVT